MCCAYTALGSGVLLRWPSTVKQSSTKGLMNNGNESGLMLVSEGKQCVTLCNGIRLLGLSGRRKKCMNYA